MNAEMKSTELTLIERADEVMTVTESRLAVFTDASAVDDLLQPVRDLVAEFEPDMATAKGRKEIASLAHKIARYKTTLDGHGKDLVADWKAKAKQVDASRKVLRDELDAMKEQVRKPLTDWENAEKARIEKHKQTLELLRELGMNASDLTLDLLELSEHKAQNIDPTVLEEFESEGHREKEQALRLINAAIVTEKARLEEERKTEEARKAEEAKAQAEREEQIRKEAEAKAKAEAEAAAQAERDRVEREKQEAAAAAKAAEERAAREKAEAERKAAEAEERARQAEQDRIRAEERAKLEAEQAAEKARQEEQQRVAAEKAAEEAARKQREADKQHIAAICNEAKHDLMLACGLDEEAAKAVVRSVYRGEIRHTVIEY